MKKILYILIITGCAALLSVSCSKDMLDTAPAGSLSGAEIFGDAGKAQSAVDGIYRLMYTNGWSVNWSPEHPGLAGFTLVRSLMGEDHFQYSQGNGWFYFDYSFGVASDWTHTSGRQYGTWNMFYTFISQANYILDNEEAVKDDAEWQNVLGQAYAIRAYSYYCLYESFCQGNYTENKDKPGVPVYTKGTNKETEGVGRGTIEGLFTQINGDFQRAVDYLASAGMPQAHSSHIDLYTAYGLWARGFAGAAELSAGCDLCRKRLEERRTETGRHAFGAGAVQQPVPSATCCGLSNTSPRRPLCSAASFRTWPSTEPTAVRLRNVSTTGSTRRA